MQPYLVAVRGGKGLIHEEIPDITSPPYLPCVGAFTMFGEKPFCLEVQPTTDTIPALVSTGPNDRSLILPPEPTISRQLLDVKALSEKEIAVIAPVLELMQTG